MNTEDARGGPAASLIIPTYNREALLVNTLSCALHQDRDDYEIVVVDQTAEHEPATAEFLREHASRIRRVAFSPPSLTAARNAGMRAARGEVFVFVDDDTSFEPDFISRHLEAHARQRPGAVQGRITEEGSPEHPHPARVNRWIRFRGGDNCPREGWTNNLTGCNFSVHREAAERVGSFDERFTGIAVHEDSDYAQRVLAAGCPIRYAPRAALFHHRSSSGGLGEGGDPIFFTAAYYRSELLFARKHFSALAVALYRLRLRRRGRRALKHLIRHAENAVGEALGRH